MSIYHHLINNKNNNTIINSNKSNDYNYNSNNYMFKCDNSTVYLVKPPDICIDQNMKLTDTNIITIIIYSIIFFFSAILNIWMLIVMYRNKKNDQSRVQRFMSHLNIADLIVTFVTIPLEIGWKWSVMWFAGNLGCKTFQFLRPLGIYLASFILISISVDRYYAIVKPFSMSDADKRANILIYSSWILSIVCSAPQIFAFSLKHHPIHKWYHQCVDFNISANYQIAFLAYQIFVSIITFFLPLIVILVSYGFILRTIVKQTDFDEFNETNRNNKTTSNNNSNNKSNNDNTFSKARNDRIRKAKIRTLKLTILIVIVFLICWTPYYVISVWFWIDKNSASKVDIRIANFLFIFAVCHCIANPLVYGLYTMNLSKHMKFNFRNRSKKNQQYQKATNNSYMDTKLSLIPKKQSKSNRKSEFLV